MKRRAVISLSDKTGVVEFAKRLEKLGFEILSTGGTAKKLTENGVKVTNVSDVTGFPECLDGRVKTLHPMIHAGILAMRSNPEHMKQLEKLGVNPIDVVAINLYPFKQTVLKEGVTREEAIENIDIGGPTMLRAAAKNWQDVSVIVDPKDYETVCSEYEQNGEVSKDTKLKLAYKVFEHTAAYDTLISSYLRKESGSPMFPEQLHAWKYGPVMPQIRHLYKDGKLTDLPSDEEIAQYQAVFDEVFREYAPSHPLTLVSVSHGELSWKRARQGYTKYESSDVPMKLDDIREDAERLKERAMKLKLLQGFLDSKGITDHEGFLRSVARSTVPVL